MRAVVPVREGASCLGGVDAVAEAGGRGVLIGDGVTDAVTGFDGVATRLDVLEMLTFRPGAWAGALAPLLADEPVVLLPHSPDGRDLAPRLAAALDRPLLAGATAVHDGGATVVRRGGLVSEDLAVDGPFVATLQPGARSVTPDPAVTPDVHELHPVDDTAGTDATVVAVDPPDPATMDLADAPRIVGIGAGLGSADAAARVHDLAAALGASVGATRVVTDLGWEPLERQIGTTGVTVDPRLYIAVAVSGAVQHVTGLGDPDHIVSVNLDPSCPMMGMADLAVVTDGPAFLDALADRLADAPAGHEVPT